MMISEEQFVRTYVPAAKAGKSALEIGNMLGVEGDEKKVAQYVTVRASQIRKRLKTKAETEAEANELSAEERAELVDRLVAKLPKLKTRGRKSTLDNLVSTLDDILASCDTPSEEVVETESPFVEE